MPEIMSRDHFPERYLPTIRLSPTSDVTAVDMPPSRVSLNSSSEGTSPLGFRKDQRLFGMDPNVASVSGGSHSNEKQLKSTRCKSQLSGNGSICKDSSRASSVLSSSENLLSPRLSPCLLSRPQSPHLSPMTSQRHSPRGAHSPSHLPAGVTTYKAPPPPRVHVSPGGTSNKGERLHTRYLEGRVTWLNNLVVTDEPWRQTSPRRPRHRELNAQEEDGQLQHEELIRKEEGDRYWTSMSAEAQLAMRQCRGEELGLQ